MASMRWEVCLYVAAVVSPLAAFAVQAFFIRQLKRLNAYIATGAIFLSFVLSLIGFANYFLFSAPWNTAEHHAAAEAGGAHALPGEAGPASVDPALAWEGQISWISLGAQPATTEMPALPSLDVPLGVRIDNLSATMFLMITFIATLVHIYSMGYMHDDERYPKFFADLSLFCFSMLGLIAASNVFMIFIFWELVGLCSYLLIGFWYKDKANGDAANKAFIVNRVGDVGMLIGLGLLWTNLGTFDFKEINEGLRSRTGILHHEEGSGVVQMRDRLDGSLLMAPDGSGPRQIPYWMLGVAGLGIFAGCVGKSAQFPLHVWLPDAMAGPTPVSALIHAATMVAAGVYLVGRFFPMFTPEVLLVIAYIGGITLLMAATIAMVQIDYKKVLAYSTISQLGFMILALGVGGWVAGLFHLITHAFFKALLFLCAGSVYHSVHTYEMPALGGLYRKMPWTANCMLIGTLAISGVPLFSGFYSKDAILVAAMARVQESPEHIMLFLLPAVGAVLTTFYMFRMWLLTFAGEARGFPTPAEEAYGAAHDEEQALDHGHPHGHAHAHDRNPAAHAHESDWVMVGPLVALAFFSITAGWGFWYVLPNPLGTPLLERMLEYGLPYHALNPEALHNLHFQAFIASLIIVLVGVGLALLYYAPPGFPFFLQTRLKAAQAAERLGGAYRFLVHKWYFDELYNTAFVRRCLGLGRFCLGIDRHLIDGLLDGAARLTALLSRWQGIFDLIAVDRMVNLTALGVHAAGDHSRSIQTGRVRNYLMFLSMALVGLCVGVFAWIRG